MTRKSIRQRRRDAGIEHRGRELISQEAARIIVEEGVRDYLEAKLRAADRLGISGEREMPRNAEIERAVREYQSIFQADEHPARLRQLRADALEALSFFADFEPKLVGPVLNGTADAFSAICLHLYSDPPEALQFFLDERGIPYDQEDRSIQAQPGVDEQRLAFTFMAGESPVDLTVFPMVRKRQAPVSPIDGKPMARANRTRLLDDPEWLDGAPRSPRS